MKNSSHPLLTFSSEQKSLMRLYIVHAPILRFCRHIRTILLLRERENVEVERA
uniref:C2 domain-containing protein n=1 Tax=Parascaris univalens TaxID=6257 RepID=A0A915ACD4_PARUN